MSLYYLDVSSVSKRMKTKFTHFHKVCFWATALEKLQRVRLLYLLWIKLQCQQDIQVHLNKLECRGKVHLFQ